MNDSTAARLVVSFCIPIYNNAEGAVKIVNALLSSGDSRFEVVVSDDNSADNARELLSGIHDERFRYYRNDKNLGAHKNWEHSLELGRGEWLYLIMGRDMVHGENVDSLIEQLIYADENGITFLKDHGHKRVGFDVHEGIDAMMNFVVSNHPTGKIFRADIFNSILGRTKYFEISDMYPEAWVTRDMLLSGKGAYIHSGVNYGGFVTDKAKVKSTVEHGGDINKMYFAPLRRTQQFLELVAMIDEKCPQVFTCDEADKYFRARYSYFMSEISYRVRIMCRDSVQMEHYGQPVRHVGIPEMIRNMLKGYHDTKAHLKAKGTYTPTRNRIMIAQTVKSIAHITMKTLIRAVIEPLGIWKILHFFRNY